MTALEFYLRDLQRDRALGAGVDEKSHYPALANLLNEVGKHLKPKVRCVMELKNLGAGNPDGGLFTADQFPKKSPDKPESSQMPSRGAIEVKPAKGDAWVTADSGQVSGYWKKYRQVLVTNYRDFILIGQDSEGKALKLEAFMLAPSEKAFWAAAPRTLDQELGERFIEFLRRVMLHAAPLAAPEDVAWFLASYAREALRRVEKAELPALSAVRQALEEALGLKFEGPKGEHFFRSSLVQTLFYGVFSAWVLWAKQNPPGTKKRFNWYETARYLRVPMISKLFYLIADPNELENLNLVEILDRTGQVLNRVDRTSFFENFQESHAVQYFYEPFLEAFDPELRKELGVWYTPPEIVQYMVERVDRVLRSELGVPLGLADKNVYVLDPCCGTGSYLVEVLNRVHRTLKERGEDALIASDLKDAAQKRVFGFEILPAPFVVSHLQLGLLLQNLGAPLSVAPIYDRRTSNGERSSPLQSRPHERVGVYLTNALTGWEPPKGPKKKLLFAEMEEERDAAEHVKREVPILVILGNPPYNAFAGVSPEEEQGLVEPYKQGLISEWGIKKFNLDDLYVRFFRVAERRIAEMTGRGIVSFISNHSWVSDPSFVVLRRHLLNNFDRFWIENMHGNRKISEYAPDGGTSETVFAIPGFSVGIQQGVAISLWVRRGNGESRHEVSLRDDLDAARAVERRSHLLETLNDREFERHYKRAQPDEANRYSFRPELVSKAYLAWPNLVSLCGSPPINGLMEKRQNALIDLEKEVLEERMKTYFNAANDWEAAKSLHPGLGQDAARFNAKKARGKALAVESFDNERIRRYALRPMETRWCYFSPVRPLWNEPRPRLWAQCWQGNTFLLSRFKAAKAPEGPPFYFISTLADDHLLTPDAACFPIRVTVTSGQVVHRKQRTFANPEAVPKANLSAHAHDYLRSIEVSDPDSSLEIASLLWMHALAIGYSPAYLAENADGIRQDWPRIPLPDSKELLLASAELGKQLAALLDTETPFDALVPQRPSSDVAASPRASEAKEPQGRKADPAGIEKPQGQRTDPALQKIAAFTLAEKRPLREKDEGDLLSDLSLTAGWGHAGKGGVTMPGKGKSVERDYAGEELVPQRPPSDVAALPRHSDVEKPQGQKADPALQLLGERTLDIYLNDAAYWKNIPLRVWEYTIGGYQVIKKWLSYRERKLLGRALGKDEVRYVQEMAQRIAAILLLESALDSNYQEIKKHTYAWPDGHQ